LLVCVACSADWSAGFEPVDADNGRSKLQETNATVAGTTATRTAARRVVRSIFLQGYILILSYLIDPDAIVMRLAR
jgi:hypothetical protein